MLQDLHFGINNQGPKQSTCHVTNPLNESSKSVILWVHDKSVMKCRMTIAKYMQYSTTCLERPPLRPQKCGFSRQMVSGDTFSCIEMVLLPKMCGLSRQVISHGSGLSIQVSLYKYMCNTNMMCQGVYLIYIDKHTYKYLMISTLSTPQ